MQFICILFTVLSTGFAQQDSSLPDYMPNFLKRGEYAKGFRNSKGGSFSHSLDHSFSVKKGGYERSHESGSLQHSESLVDDSSLAGATFTGGCGSRPKAPPNAKLECSSYSGCVATCLRDYHFPNGETRLYITCQSGEWEIRGSEWPRIPPCEPRCLPPCQNGGFCLKPGQCSCSGGYSGPQCQFSRKPCLMLPPLPRNARRNCTNKFCQIACVEGHQFSDGSSAANMQCKDGTWQPSRKNWETIPDCLPMCNPPCENGGVCLAYNICECPQALRGPQCQYSADACTLEKLSFTGTSRCRGNGEEFTCRIACAAGGQFESPPAEEYKCDYATGRFTPFPVPKCIYPNDVEIIESKKHSRYNYSVSSWSASDNINPFHDHEINIHTVETLTRKGGFCYAWSAAHIRSFDGLILNFESSCSYILTKDAVDNTFTIGIEPRADYIAIHVLFAGREYILELSEDTSVPIIRSLSNNKIISIPTQLTGINAYYSAHYVILSLTSLNLNIRWDGTAFIVVEVGSELWNRTSGLCGLLDGRIDDDLTIDGKRTRLPAFLSSSLFERPGEPCSSEPILEHPCIRAETSNEVKTASDNFCDRIVTEPRFASCRNLIDIESFVEACRWDYCACTSLKNPQICACSSLSVLARECRRLGVDVGDWRNDHLCPMNCTGGRIYTACTESSGQETCGTNSLKDMKTSSSTHICEEGCVCPIGTVLHEHRCIPKAQCPCRLRGKIFQPGEQIAKDCNTCTCVEGSWSCTDVKCASRCSAIGDPHYTTFDGRRYDFMGKCSYILLRTGNISVEAENVACSGAISLALGLETSSNGENPSCTKSITIKLDKSIIHLKQGGDVSVDGQDISLPIDINGAYLHIVSSIFLQAELNNGLMIWWDGVSRVYIDAPAEFQGKTQGLCGTFNRNQNDDFLTPEGDIEQAIVPFADKWRTSEKCDESVVQPTSHQCDLNPERKPQAEKICSPLKGKLFQSCHWFVDPEPFYQDCLYDVCSCKGASIGSCLCPILASYAKECADHGVAIEWRGEIRTCGVHCPSGQVFQACGNACSRSCFDLATRPKCESRCVEGCNCPEGEALDDRGECVPHDKCPCENAGRMFPPGYKEVRPGAPVQETCSCVGAKWECEAATEFDLASLPHAEDAKTICSNKKHQEFTPCEPIEPITCKNMHNPPAPTTPAICHPGCKCKSGYVFDSQEKTCIRPDACPCHHGGKSYSDGDAFQQDCNECKCSHGHWTCTERKCASTCSTWGESHYSTFDGRLYEFQGDCEYVFAKGALGGDDTFSISLQVEVCSALGASCTKGLTLNVGGNISESISLNSANIPNNLQDKISKLRRINVREVGLYIIIEVTDLGLILRWDKSTTVHLRLDPRWKSRIRGLCGNYNDDNEDDLETPSGGSEVSPQVFGDSWRLQTLCPEALPINDACSEHRVRRTWSTKQCSVLKSEPFSSCHSEVPLEPYLDRCIWDACACDQGGDCKCLCTSISVYAYQCALKGIILKWRTQELCPIQCDESCSHYNPCMSACPLETCDTLITKTTSLCGEDVCVEGCEPKPCLVDQVHANLTFSECVPRNTCQPICMIKGTTRYYEGDLVETHGCEKCYCSRGQLSCTNSECTTEISTFLPINDQSICKDGWSSWINQDGMKTKGVKTKSAKLKKPQDIEPLPSLEILSNSGSEAICSLEDIVDIRCRTVGSHKDPKSTGQDVECSLERGLFCKGKCFDYEISVKCRCIPETTTTTTTTIVPIYMENLENIFCDPNEPLRPHETDCEKYLQCDHGDWLIRECAPGTFYNPSTMVCDWPANVAIIRSECAEPTTPRTLSTFIPYEISTLKRNEQIRVWTTSTESNLLIIPYTKTPLPLCDTQDLFGLITEEVLLSPNYTSSSSRAGWPAERASPRGPPPSDIDDGDTWTPSEIDESPFLQVDLGQTEPIYGTSVAGSPFNQAYVTSYDILHSDDAQAWSYISNHPFRGPFDSEKPLREVFDNPVESRYWQVRPRTWIKAPSMQVDFLGCGRPSTVAPQTTLSPTTTTKPLPCSDPMGIETGEIGESQIKVSSIFNGDKDNFGPSKLSFKSESAWSPDVSDKTPYIQIDLLEPRTLTGLLTAGHPNGWIESYTISYSPDGVKWSPFLETNGIDNQFFAANFDGYTKHTSNFTSAISTRYLRIQPTKWHGKPSLKLEILGCYEPPVSTPEVQYPILEETTVPTTCKICPGVSEEQAFNCIGCPTTLLWDGISCVPSDQCPCFVNQIRYSVKSAYRSENCEECICMPGGVSNCKEATCPTCGEGLRPLTAPTCECLCKPCPPEERLCPTSGVCIPETQWCDGIIHCPDDEKDCAKQTENKNETLIKSHEIYEEEVARVLEPCPKQTCQPGYELQSEEEFIAKKRASKTISKSSKTSRYLVGRRPQIVGGTRPSKSSKCPRKLCVTSSEACPVPSCPPNYELVLEAVKGKPRSACAAYRCILPAATCELAGHTLRTFDGSELRVEVCEHVLARGIHTGDAWDVSISKVCDQQECTRRLVIVQDDDTVVLGGTNKLEYNDATYSVQQAQRIGLGSDDFRISRVGDIIFFESKKYGFSVVWDELSGAKITVPGENQGRVDGLCGYYDGDAVNDRRKPDGSLADSTAQFLESWASRERKSNCEEKICPKHLQAQAVHACASAITRGPIRACEPHVHLSRLQGLCVERLCECLLRNSTTSFKEESSNSFEDCRCQALLHSFISECRIKADAPDLSDWRTELDCPVSCPEGLVYQDCYQRKCEPSCATLSQGGLACPVQSSWCASGCYCPPGLVRNHDRCVPPASCQDCRCDALGHSQYRTFDGATMTLLAVCSYIVTKGPGFEVRVTNIPCHDRPSQACPVAIEIEKDKHVATLRRRQPGDYNPITFLIDDEVAAIPYEGFGFKVHEIHTQPLEIAIEVPSLYLQASYHWDKHGISVRLPSHTLGGKIEGLCGDCDGDPSDDIPLEGVDKLAERFLVDKNEIECGPKPTEPPVLNTCLNEEESKACEALFDDNIFGKCLPLVDPKPLVEACKAAACNEPKSKDRCDWLSTYASQCQASELCISWRKAFNCPISSCPAGLEYQACSCDHMCDQPEGLCTTETEGCFCPENLVRLNGSCVEQKKCHVCDSEGHVEGDIWKIDACTECRCLNDAKICQVSQCASKETACELGMVAELVASTQEECCPRYICVPGKKECNDTLQPQPECGPDQQLKSEELPDGCHIFVCECLPSEECPTLSQLEEEELGVIWQLNKTGCCPHLERICLPEKCPEPPTCWPHFELKSELVSTCCPNYTCICNKETCPEMESNIWEPEPGIERRLDITGCCPKIEKICKPETCPTPDCPKHFEIIELSGNPQMCCKNYTCEPPKACIYERLNNSSELRKFGEVWNDGNCRKCECISHEEGGLLARCTDETCPDSGTDERHTNYILEKIPRQNNECCEKLRVVACKDGDHVRKVGEEWTPTGVSPCLKFQCIEKEDGQIETRSKLQVCDDRCAPGWEYKAPLNDSGICCGECKQVACVDSKGIEHEPDSKWKSDDFCTNYMCISQNETLQINSLTTVCALPAEEEELSYQLEYEEVENECCKRWRRTACFAFNKTLKAGESLTSPTDPCQEAICELSPTSVYELRIISKSCDKKCSLGWSYIEPKNNQCCGVCEPIGCVVEETFYHQGQTWKEDNCTNYTCEILENQPQIIRQEVSCPTLDGCTSEEAIQDGCCRKCPPRGESSRTCTVEPTPLDQTLNAIVIRDAQHGQCFNMDPVHGIQHCQGVCNSFTELESGSIFQRQVCFCCKASSSRSLVVPLTCEDGFMREIEIQVPTDCSCEQCSATEGLKKKSHKGITAFKLKDADA